MDRTRRGANGSIQRPQYCLDPYRETAFDGTMRTGLCAIITFQTWSDRNRAATRDTIGNFYEELE